MEITGDLGEFAAVAGSGPVITVIIAGLRSVGVAQQYTPLIAMLIGLAFALVAIFLGSVPILPTLFVGVLAGASATGLHQAGKSVNNEVLNRGEET